MITSGKICEAGFFETPIYEINGNHINSTKFFGGKSYIINGKYVCETGWSGKKLYKIDGNDIIDLSNNTKKYRLRGNEILENGKVKYVIREDSNQQSKNSNEIELDINSSDTITIKISNGKSSTPQPKEPKPKLSKEERINKTKQIGKSCIIATIVLFAIISLVLYFKYTSAVDTLDSYISLGYSASDKYALAFQQEIDSCKSTLITTIIIGVITSVIVAIASPKIVEKQIEKINAETENK